MACYDCDDCNNHINKGGKCRKFEYTCPYGLVEFTDVKSINQINNKAEKIKQLIQEIILLDKEDMLSDEISILKNGLMDILEFSSEQMIREWEDIIKI